MQHLIAQLNHIAEYHRSLGVSLPESLDRAAAQAMLTLVSDRDDRRVYLAASGMLLGCIVTGENAGFTANITWYFDDLITLTEAAKMAGITVQGIRQAILSGRMRAFHDPDVHPRSRHGRTLVRESVVEKLYSKVDNQLSTTNTT